MYNKLILVGNLTRDIEIRNSNSGSAIANTGIATSRKFKGADGQIKEETMFIDLTFFGRQAEIASQYLRKGSKILVDGRLSLQQWTAQDGTKRSKHVLIVKTMQMLYSRQQSESHTQPEYTQPEYTQPEYTQPEYTQPQQQQRPQQQPAYNAPVSPQDSQNFQNANNSVDIDDDEIPF